MSKARSAAAGADQIVKLIVEAGKASPSPPVGPALGSKGVKSMDFCKVKTTPIPTGIMRRVADHNYPGVQRANSTYTPRNAHANPSHGTSGSIISLRCADATNLLVPQECGGFTGRQERKEKGSEQARPRDSRDSYFETRLRDCEGEANRTATLRSSSTKYLQIGHRASQINGYRRCCVDD